MLVNIWYWINYSIFFSCLDYIKKPVLETRSKNKKGTGNALHEKGEGFTCSLDCVLWIILHSTREECSCIHMILCLLPYDQLTFLIRLLDANFAKNWYIPRINRKWS